MIDRKATRFGIREVAFDLGRGVLVNGEQVATDNGDPTDMTAFPSAERRAFNGLALGIVRARPGNSGDIRVTIESPGLDGTELTLRAN